MLFLSEFCYVKNPNPSAHVHESFENSNVDPDPPDKEDKSEDKPAAQATEAKDKSVKVAQAKNGQAYQVMFDDSQQKMKMQKPATASFNHSKLPPIVMKGQGPGQDLRRLSAQNWRKQRKQV